MARGFASLTPEQRSEAGRRGAAAAKALGKLHRFTPEEAKAAGSKGGKAVAEARGREYMAEIGRRHGKWRTK